jgi:hypothetical protein
MVAYKVAVFQIFCLSIECNQFHYQAPIGQFFGLGKRPHGLYNLKYRFLAGQHASGVGVTQGGRKATHYCQGVNCRMMDAT